MGICVLGDLEISEVHSTNEPKLLYCGKNNNLEIFVDLMLILAVGSDVFNLNACLTNK